IFDLVGSGAVDLSFLALGVTHVPAQLPVLRGPRVLGVEPGPPSLDDPKTLGPSWRVAGTQHPAALVGICRAVPANDEVELALVEVADLIEHDEVVRLAFVPLLILLVGQPIEVDDLVAATPAADVLVPAITRAGDLHQPIA